MESTPPALRTRSILVAEDDPNLNVLLSRVLHANGFTVTSVRNGAEAIQKIETMRFDAMVLDVMMPLVGGQGIVEHLSRTDPSLLERVIILSAIPAEAVRPRVGGVSAVLKKPFSASDLIAAVDAVVFGS